jgi:hypothetical protein
MRRWRNLLVLDYCITMVSLNGDLRMDGLASLLLANHRVAVQCSRIVNQIPQQLPHKGVP